MDFVYLGFFEKVTKWVLQHILQPITDWLGTMLNKLFSWCVNTLIIPALQNIILPLVTKVFKLIYKSLAGIIYRLFAQLLNLINNMNAVFDSIIGLSDVSYKGESMPLLDVFFRETSLSKLFWYMTFVGFSLCLLFSAISVARSAFDLDFEGKKPVSRVLSMTLKAMLYLFGMQFFVYVIVRLSGAVLIGIRTAVDSVLTTGGSDTPTLGGIIFAVASMNAAQNSAYNLPDGTLTSGPRGSYYYGRKPLTDYKAIGELFYFEKFDYLIGLIVAVFLLIIMAACLLVFVRRLFDLIVLYISSPFFVATYPLDDGKRFMNWRSQFVGKAFSGFGMVVAMKLYLMLVPLIMQNGIVFSNVTNAQSTSPEFDYIVKIGFLVGGAWAILKSGPMITSLINEAVGAQEERDAAAGAAMAAFAGGAVLSYAKSKGGSLLSNMFGKKKGEDSEENDGKEKGKEGEKEKGRNGTGNGSIRFGKKKNSALRFLPKTRKPAGSEKAPGLGKAAASSAAGQMFKDSGNAVGKAKADNPKDKLLQNASIKDSAMKGIGGGDNKAAGANAGNPSNAAEKAGGQKFYRKTEGEVMSSHFFGLYKKYRITTRDENGQEHTAIRGGLDFGIGHIGGSEQGWKFSLFGFGWRTGEDGKRETLDPIHTSSDGTERQGIPLLWQDTYAKDPDTGERYKVSSSRMFGLYKTNYAVDPDTNQSVVISKNYGWGGYKRFYAKDPDSGKMQVIRDNVMGATMFENRGLEDKLRKDKKEEK